MLASVTSRSGVERTGERDDEHGNAMVALLHGGYAIRVYALFKHTICQMWSQDC